MENIKLPLAEMFGPTVQGEGNAAGKKVGFIRFSGCDFRCAWCDSTYTHAITKDTERLAVSELLERTKQMFINKVSDIVLTGGNPALYNLEPFIDGLHELGFTVHIETQGSKWPQWLSKVDNIIISPKGPSSKMNVDAVEIAMTINDWTRKRTNYLRAIEEYGTQKVTVKIPIFDDIDYEWAKTVYKTLEMKYVNRFYLSVGNHDVALDADKKTVVQKVLSSYTWLLDKVLADDEYKDIYVLPQIHTLVWGNITGV